MRAADLPDVLRDAGLDVDVMAGFATRGRDMAAVNGLMWHHTASSPSASDDNMLRLLRDGRSDLPGPLYQVGLTRDGTWHLVASGRANHAGRGSWPGLDGNDDTLGVGAFHAGSSVEQWDDHQLASLRVGSAAICRAYGIDPERFLLGHKEWTARKVDPYALDMHAERRNVAALTQEDIVAEWKSDKAREAAERLRARGIFTPHTPPGDVVDTDSLAIYLDGMCDWIERRDGSGGHTHRASVRLD